MEKLLINKDLWDKVSDDNKQNIEAILKRTGSISEDTLIESSDHFSERENLIRDAKKRICKAGCDATYHVAEAACKELSGDAETACIIAASLARDACRDHC
ncbi:hypothetical protein P9Z39_29260 [Bacillus thuringiensis]|uniref:hypothetical protein n=1 Tax=Bacillus thuringiensis TaxID=1428 RepID=UPI002DBD784A|nr:hypothetical protein [Bacillus thuringiensis]MEC2709700.1 hypothetical protein [Bacillus thuringiensis]